MSINVISTTEYSLSELEKTRLYEIMRDAYASTEEEIWGKNYIRMSKSEYFQLLDEDQVLIAKWNNEIAGCIYYYQKDEKSFGFGLLGTHMDFTKRGIGKSLIQAVEDLAKKAGAQFMKIEILRVRGVDVPGKIILKKWYETLGYSYTHSEDFAKIKPEKASLLLKPSDFDCYKKVL
ncbi:MAG: GNAT family N-acetyltransferase [Crocinitomicaceae bacterium]|nr:GNAT family N-acetyltransferase [Crocinitomicaceae bacterium]